LYKKQEIIDFKSAFGKKTIDHRLQKCFYIKTINRRLQKHALYKNDKSSTAKGCFVERQYIITGPSGCQTLGHQ